MKTNKFFLLLILIVTFMIGLTAAEDTSYKITLLAKTYEVSYVSTVNQEYIVYYNFTIILHNAGTIDSIDYTINITDDEGFSLYKNDTIPTKENKTFTWTNHPLLGAQDHSLTISYYPTDYDKRNSTNIGSDTLVLKSGIDTSSNDKTPGFEAILFLFAISLLILYKKNVRKNLE